MLTLTKREKTRTIFQKQDSKHRLERCSLNSHFNKSSRPSTEYNKINSREPAVSSKFIRSLSFPDFHNLKNVLGGHHAAVALHLRRRSPRVAALSKSFGSFTLLQASVTACPDVDFDVAASAALCRSSLLPKLPSLSSQPSVCARKLPLGEAATHASVRRTPL